MKKTLKTVFLSMFVLAAAFMISGKPVNASGYCSECGEYYSMWEKCPAITYLENGRTGDNTHVDRLDCVNINETQHRLYCKTCCESSTSSSYHRQICSKASFVEAHNLYKSVSGDTITYECTTTGCGYKRTEVCNHADKTVIDEHTSQCGNCGKQFKTEHNYTYVKGDGNRHTMKCSICGYSTSELCIRVNNSKYDTTKLKKITYTVQDPYKHHYIAVCKCGYQFDYGKTASHTFVNGKCSKCKMPKQPVPGAAKIKSFTATKGSKYSVKYPAKWRFGWSGNSWEWKYFPAGKINYYKRTFKASWTKPSKTTKFEYIIYENGSIINSGTTKKTSVTFKGVYGLPKGKKLQFKIRPVYTSKYGDVYGKYVTKTITSK